MSTTTTKAPGSAYERYVAHLVELREHDYALNLATRSELESVAGRVDVIEFRRPASSMFRVEFVWLAGTLVVMGDVHPGVYRGGWNNITDWAKADLHYFRSKCEASADGRRADGWDEATAREHIRHHYAEHIRHGGEHYRARRRVFEASRGFDALTSREEWHSWLDRHGYESFGQDWWDFAPTFGRVPSVDCIGHWVALRMAAASLAAASSRVTPLQESV